MHDDYVTVTYCMYVLYSVLYLLYAEAWMVGFEMPGRHELLISIGEYSDSGYYIYVVQEAASRNEMK